MSLIKDYDLELELQQATDNGYFITADFSDTTTFRNKPTKNSRDRREKRAMKRQGFIY